MKTHVTCAFFAPSRDDIQKGANLPENYPYSVSPIRPSCLCPELGNAQQMGICHAMNAMPACIGYKPRPTKVIRQFKMEGDEDIQLCSSDLGYGYSGYKIRTTVNGSVNDFSITHEYSESILTQIFDLLLATSNSEEIEDANIDEEKTSPAPIPYFAMMAAQNT